MKFLISTEPDDPQAILVKLTLQERGHQVRLLFTADLPTRQKNSVSIDSDGYRWKSTDKYDTFFDNEYDVVWWMRSGKPSMPKDGIHPDDRAFVHQENVLFHESIIRNLAPNAWWINDRDAATRANSKLRQLNMARECGLNIPVTLCSNDPQDIRHFLLKHEADGVIYKPLRSTCWVEEDEVTRAYTSSVSFLELPNNKLLQCVPGIYQKEIKKKYELRVTCFGDYLVTAKLDADSFSESEKNIEPYMLPVELERKIRIFMDTMGLVFACFDFIVSTDDDYIFVDVNEQGEFLWIEQSNPGFKMLDIFTSFLINKTRNFRWNPQNYQHELSDYLAEMDNIFFRNTRRHVQRECSMGYSTPA